MTSLMVQEKRTARRKGLLAAATAGGGALLAIVSHPVLAVVALAGATYLTVDWFKYRAKRGMRF